jgi:ABC-type transport system involved in multi-copper enzyme maturation permease subunit
MSAPAKRPAVGGGAATLAIAGLTLRRLFRGKTIWVSVFFAFIPLVFATLVAGRGPRHNLVAVTLEVSVWLLGILPALHLASSLSEDLEDRTSAYLWSRPIPRWSILTGKVLALVPWVLVLELGGAFIAMKRLGPFAEGHPLDRVAIGLGAGTIAASCAGLGMSTLWPKHGMSIAIVYMLFVDLTIGLIPASLQNLSITHHVRDIVRWNESLSTPLTGLGVIAGLWLVVALARIRRLE